MAALMKPKSFVRSNEGSLTTYDYKDVADGTGVIVFNAGQCYTGSTSAFILDGNTFYSDLIYNSYNGASSMTFDTGIFNTPRTVKGNAVLSIPIWNSSASNAGTVKITIQKVSGGSASSISSQTTVNAPIGNGAYNMTLTRVALTETNFAIGDNLRVVIDITVTNGTIEIAHDPAGRYQGNITSALTAPPMVTKMTVAIPFKLDL